jgi:hypothetical protein
VGKPRIHYLSFYLAPGMEDEREPNPAGFPKIEYIRSSALAAGADVQAVSTAIAKPGRLLRRQTRDGWIYLPTIRLTGGRVGYGIALVFMWAQLVRYLLTEVKADDTVLAYHSLSYVLPLRAIRRVKRFRFVLELNELYTVYTRQSDGRRAAEERFARTADAYVVMNRHAAREVTGRKPHVISHGTYSAPDRQRPQRDDGKIHAVYAGVVDFRRGAALAAEAALHLDDRFAVHILGYGPADAVADLEATVAVVNEEVGREAVTYHGTKYGRDLTDFLHGCHIGLSTHAYLPSEAEIALYSFPSKVPLYVAHDLRVVSSVVPVVVDSAFAELITFYEASTPESIAAAIEESAENLTGGRSPASLMAELDDQFRRELPGVLAG